MRRITIDPSTDIQLNNQMIGRPVVNYTIDPDRCSNGLVQIERIVQTLRAPCFNHPSAVARTTRHGVAKLLKDDPQLHIPRTEDIRAGSAVQLRERIAELGLRYPLLLRVPGMHVGAYMQKVDTPAAIDEAVYAMPILGRGIYATEFVDFRSGDGKYRKMRLVVVGEQVFMRHYIVAANWNVHADDRIDPDDPEENAVFDAFPAGLPVDVAAIARRIADVLGMDYFGINCNLQDDGRLLIFEANAAMDILRRDFKAYNENSRWKGRIDAIENALLALLFAPERWRCAVPSTAGA